MKPKEKAKEIFNKMYQVDDIMGNYPMCFDTAKKCAIIAVDEILNITQTPIFTIDFNGIKQQVGWQNDSYWFEVYNEIQKL